jgi:hypothetical protein
MAAITTFTAETDDQPLEIIPSPHEMLAATAEIIPHAARIVSLTAEITSP